MIIEKKAGKFWVCVYGLPERIGHAMGQRLLYRYGPFSNWHEANDFITAEREG